MSLLNRGLAPAPVIARPPRGDRFWAKVSKTDGCWLWRASVDRWGYGQIGSSGKPRTMLKAHRVSWEFAYGAIPDGLSVLHRCDTPACVRPEHLFLGTQQDNVADMNAKGRNRFQRQNPALKLSEEQVRAIRHRRSRGEKLAVLSFDFRVSQSTISRIANKVRRPNVG